MNGTFIRALCALGLAASSMTAMAAEPIDVTIYMDRSFRTQWGPAPKDTEKATAIFNDVKNYYKSTFNIDLRLMRVDVPFFTVDNAPDGNPTTATSILGIMRTNLKKPTGANATSHPTSWLFVHRDTGTGVAGRVDNIGGISKGGFPNLWLSTWEARRNSNSNAFGGVCPAIPARARTAAAIKRTAIHEFSHLMAAVHVSSTSTCTNSVMCLPAPAECGGGLQDPVWLEPSEPTAMDADNRARVNRHATCYLNKNTDWHDCMIMHVP